MIPRIAAALLVVTIAPLRAQGPPGMPIDLSHPFDETTIYWPTADPFALRVVAEGRTEGGFWYAANAFCAAEHGGTHLDAPIHFAEGKRTAAEIPLADLMGPAIVVDVSEKAASNPDYLVSAADLDAFEADHGRIADRSIVLLRTGWGARWPDPEAYLGTVARGPAAVRDLHFPGLDPDAARWLVSERNVRAVGIDTASIDYGQSTDYRAHQALAAANVPIFENLASLDKLPPTSAWVIALPIKITHGTGGPLRAVAFLSAD